MKPHFLKSLLLILFFISNFILAQNTITGKIIDQKNRPIAGANVFIEGSYDGATTNEKGEFTFETTETGTKKIIATFLGFNDNFIEINTKQAQNISVQLKPNLNTLDTVVISAGSIKAGDNSKVSALKPLDIVTTASALGDIVGALQTLPGAQVAGESGRLLVRGGEANETQTFIDGIRVAQPYGVTANNLPTRGRFSPFLFNGITFSTGGYSAEFGDALSSVLLLNSISEPDQNKMEIGIMSVGASFGRTKKWEKSSFSVNTSYTDLTPYQALVPQNITWNKPFRGLSGESIFRKKFTSGIFKLYVAFDYATFDLNQKNINFITPIRVNNNNNNLYINSSYKGKFGTGWSIFAGASFGLNNVYFNFNQDKLKNNETATHAKIKLDKKFNQHITTTFGADSFFTQFNEIFTEFGNNSFKSGYKNVISAMYSETDFIFSQNVALKVGARATNSNLLKQFEIEPRASMAVKVSKNNQFSFAYGTFNQTPNTEYLKFNNSFSFEKTKHYILNFLHTSDKRILRTELYYKNYNNLVQYNTPIAQFNSTYNQLGYGYAKGFDLFWRDSKSIKNFDYWVSYSFINSERKYKNFPTQVQPNFVANHTLSIVGKYWINSIKSQISATNTFGSGRPFNNPNQTQFMNDKTKEFNSLSLAYAYLISQQKVLFFSVTNVLGRDNVFGYQYANNADINGVFQREAIRQPADRFFFVGFFWTISTDKKANNLDNLVN